MSEIDRYRKDGGIEILLDLNLNEESVVFDVGAYTGNFSKRILDKFNCNVYCFEPIKKHFNILKRNLHRYKKVKFFNIALGDKWEEIEIVVKEDRSSMYISDGEIENCISEDFFIRIEEEKIKKIDLFIINAEGAEYQLLPYILKNQNDLIETFIIQFHDFAQRESSDRNYVRKLLSKKYEEIFSYDFVWEKWKRK